MMTQRTTNNSNLEGCRVLYIGSAVPTVTKDGLQGIQQPLRERYPTTESPEARGIDSWLSVYYNGLLLEYVDGDKRTESAFFPISTLHYCAAVRFVNMGGFSVEGGGERFIPLDSPFAMSDSSHPPIFAAIFRRTTGVKVLECHGFICTNEKAANALVFACFHAYSDTMYLKLDDKLPAIGASGPKAFREPTSPTSRSTPSSELNLSEQESGLPVENSAEWNERAIGQKTWQRRQQSGEYDTSSISSSLAKKGGSSARQPMNGRQEGIVVPYGENGYNASRRAASHSELRSPAGGPDFFDSPRHRPPPMFFGPIPPPGMQPMFGPPPVAFMRPPPQFYPPMPPQFQPRPVHFHSLPPPHFGRIVPFPPHMMHRPPFLMMPPPPHFMGPHPHGIRPKSPDRPGGGPIITDVYDTFPRQNRPTYEEPIYMPSSNNPVPPQASYKPGSFSPELYEHYYETYRHHRIPENRHNMSRSNSDASVEYWEGGAFDTNAFRKTRANERTFANTLVGEGKKSAAGSVTPKVNGSPVGTSKKGGAAGEGTLTKGTRTDGHAGALRASGEPRPETPPADYEFGADMRGIHHRMAAF